MANARLLLRSLHVLFLLLLPSPMALAIPDSEALLLLKKSFDGPSTLDSWQPGSKPCDNRSRWVGLICENGVITGIHLGSMGLSGKIDVRALVQIPGLRTLSFNNNSFAGPIPELNRIPALKAVYVSQNKFSGEIPPDFFAKMASLKRVWLSHNNFSGEVPPSLFRLPRLIELRLENNQFAGTIPGIRSPALASADFSNNRLEGKIPESLYQIDAGSFAGNPGLCGEKLRRSCDEAAAQQHQQQQSSSSQQETDRAASNTAAAAALMTVAAVIFSLMVAAIFLMRKRRGKEKFDVLENEVSEDSVEVHVPSSRKKETDSSGKNTGFGLRGSSSKGGRGAGLVVVNEEKGVFGMPDLMKAAAEALGNGSLGSSYKAVMSDGVAVAVKRMREMNVMGRDGFDAEMRRLGRLQHRNVLTPLAYHHRLDEKLLVHEYIPKGSLLYLLHGNASSQDILQFPFCFL